MLGLVDDHRNVAALAGDAGARPARENRRAVLMTDLDGADAVIGRARNDDADRNLAIVRRVGGVERAIAGAESHFACNRRAEVCLHRPAEAGHYRLVVSAFRRTSDRLVVSAFRRTSDRLVVS